MIPAPSLLLICGVNIMKRVAFSLRDSLVAQGVTCETALKLHLNFVYETLLVNPLLDISRYKVNPHNTSMTMMG